MCYQGRILDVVSRWPGSAHDARIFTNSKLCTRLRRGDFGNDSITVCDSAYPPERFVCKPLARTNSYNERLYQHTQIRARNVVERVNGQLKKRFPILKCNSYYLKSKYEKKEMKIHYSFSLQ